MKIQKCTICGTLFFIKPNTTDYAKDFDSTACSQCNENARQNSFPPINRKKFLQGMEEKKSKIEECMHSFEIPGIEIIPINSTSTGATFYYKRIPYVSCRKWVYGDILNNKKILEERKQEGYYSMRFYYELYDNI